MIMHVHIVENFHERNDDCTHMDWLPYSPHLNTIKDGYDMLGRALAKVEPQSTTRETRKGSKAYLSSSERYLTLHIIRHRP